jgi:hypothetical protein
MHYNQNIKIHSEREPKMQIKAPTAVIPTQVPSAAQSQSSAKPVPKTTTENAGLDELSLSSPLKAAGQRFVAGAVNGAKAAAIPTILVATGSLIASDPDYAGLAILAGPSIGLLGAGAAGLVVGGTANVLGAGKTTSTLGGAAAGAAAGWALNNLGSPKARLISAGMGAAIGGATGFAASGAKLEATDLNKGIGAVVGMVGVAGVSLALSRGKDMSAWGMLLTVAGGVGGYQAVKALSQE